MMVDCQEAMGVEAQAPERISGGGASVATIESLRARLLAERAASKEARQHVEKIALQVSELQSRLDAETEQRKKAELAMNEVLEVLRAKGLAMDEVRTAVYSISGSSESEDAAQLSSSKDAESENLSGEEASHVHIENHQCSLLKVSHTEAKISQLEAGDSAEDSLSDRTQITLTDTSRTVDYEVEKAGVSKIEGSLRIDDSDVEKQGMTENEKANNLELALLTENAKANSNEQVLLTNLSEELPPDQLGEVINISQPPEILGDSAKHLERQIIASTERKPDADCANGSASKSLARAAPSDEEVSSEGAATLNLVGGHEMFTLLNEASSSGDVEKPKGLFVDESAQIPCGRGDQSAHGGETLHLVGDRMARGLSSRDVAPHVRESTLGLGYNHMHPGLFPRGGHPYELPYMSGDRFQHMHCVPSAEAPFSKGPMSTGYGAEYGRHSLAPVSDAILSLVDDKSGKLGSILMALNLAKQQINDDDYSTSYMEEVCEAASQSPFSDKPYPGLYEGVAHRPPHWPWRSELQNQAPIIHLPMSPTSDNETSAFDRHDGVCQSNATPAYFMPGYDPYLQPKGELHLGNGITLYTD